MPLTRALLGAPVFGMTLALALAGCDAPATPQPAPPVEVGVYQVQPQAYTVTSTLPGRAVAVMTSPVRPQVDGIIRKRMFREGAQVKAGEVLYQIDPARYQATYDSAAADLAQARAAVQASRPRAERFRELARIDAVSAQDRDDAVATLAQTQADVATARADLETARINLGYTRIEAPIDGQIGASQFTPGALITANQAEPLATIQQLDPIYVDIQQTATQYLQLKRALADGSLEAAGDNAARVRISVVGDTETALDGRLEFTGVQVDPDTGAVRLRAVAPNPDHRLLPGMYVQATLEQGVDRNALLVPQQGVARTERGQAFCMVVDADNRVRRRVLSITSAANDRWRVTDGLAPGDRVIIQGTDKVRAGDRVKVTPVTFNADGEVTAVDARAAAGQR